MKIRFNYLDITQQCDTAIKGALIIVFGSTLSSTAAANHHLQRGGEYPERLA